MHCHQVSETNILHYEICVLGPEERHGSACTFGIFSYALLRISYDLFYQPFGIRIEELGIGYAELLSQALIGFVLLLAIFLMVWIPLIVAYEILVRYAIGSVRSIITHFRRILMVKRVTPLKRGPLWRHPTAVGSILRRPVKQIGSDGSALYAHL